MAVGVSRDVRSLVPRASADVPDASEVLEQLERILASPDFDASPRSRDFVRFVLEETLAGRPEALTQVAIATRVFRRREDFDPTVDPIVRIQAGRLRRSLERYYLLGGASDPVRIELPRGTYAPLFRWASPHEQRPKEEPSSRGTTDDDGWPRVLVRPFEVDGEGASLAAATVQLESVLCVELGRYGDVRVVRRRDLDRLGAAAEASDFELSGTLSRKAGGIEVTARLLRCPGAQQVWAEEYQSASRPAAGFVDETALLIAACVASEQGYVARQLMAEQPGVPAAAESSYAAVIRSYRLLLHRDPLDFAPALGALQRVVRERPTCALAWVQLARMHLANHGFELAEPESTVEEAIECALRAIQLDPSSHRARVALAAAFLMKGELAAGRAETEKALALLPGSLVYTEWIGWLLAFLGEWERGTALIRQQAARNPRHVGVTAHALWADHLRRGEVEQAYQVALQLGDAGFFWRPLMRACCLGHLGRAAEAAAEVAELRRRKPDFASRGRVLIGRYIKFPDLFERVVDGLAKAGLVLD